MDSRQLKKGVKGKFPAEIHAHLGFYVYRLIDPRDGRTFYVGRGQKDRVFEHMSGVISAHQEEDQQADEQSEKVKLIRAILNEGLQPIHIIHRHGLTLEEAKLAEAVLIDATAGLSNIQGGYHSNEFGPSNASQLIQRYKAEVAEIPEGLKVLAFSVNKSSDTLSFYEAVRGFWRIGVERASKADVILAVKQGVCRGVFIAERWLPAEPVHFTSLEESIPGRSGFIGREANDEYKSLFLDKKLPDELTWKKGVATPFLYNYA